MQPLLSTLIIIVCVACTRSFNYGRMSIKLVTRGRFQVRLFDAIENAPNVYTEPITEDSSKITQPAGTLHAAPKRYMYKKPTPSEIKAFDGNKSFPCSSERYRQGLNAAN
jgi:hypothetical protein